MDVRGATAGPETAATCPLATSPRALTARLPSTLAARQPPSGHLATASTQRRESPERPPALLALARIHPERFDPQPYLQV